jgi:regulator of cell morphogenesis and NO signaling
MALRDLVTHIVDTHHVYLRRELPRLEAIIEKMSANHGQERPELFQIQQLLKDLRSELLVHLAKEEQVLFPYIEALDSGSRADACFPNVEFPVRMMLLEHDRAQSLLLELRAATSNYTPPPSTTCDCARRFYKGLADLDSDLMEHIRVENEQLFPRAIELDRQLASCL